MTYKFTTSPVGLDQKLVCYRGKGNHRILVKETTSPKKFLKYFKELKGAVNIPDNTDEEDIMITSIYEMDLIVNLMNSCTNCPDSIKLLKINEACLANDGWDLYRITRISRHLCHCKWFPFAS